MYSYASNVRRRETIKIMKDIRLQLVKAERSYHCLNDNHVRALLEFYADPADLCIQSVHCLEELRGWGLML